MSKEHIDWRTLQAEATGLLETVRGQLPSDQDQAVLFLEALVNNALLARLVAGVYNAAVDHLA